MLKGTGRQHAPPGGGPPPGKELVTGPNLFQRSRRMPTLTVDSSDQHRQLVVKLSCLIDRQAVAKAMYYRSQRLVGVLAIRAKYLLVFFEL
jgi:hypothetical protein